MAGNTSQLSEGGSDVRVRKDDVAGEEKIVMAQLCFCIKIYFFPWFIITAA